MSNVRGRGSVLVLTAVLMLVLVGVLGLSIDTAYLYRSEESLQATADAAALAGAQDVLTSVSLARSQAAAIAAANTVNGAAVQLASNPSNSASGDIVLGVFNTANGTFTPTLTSPNAVEVCARFTASSVNGPVNLIFGPAFGVNTANIQRTAIAINGVSAASAAGVIVLNPTASPSMSLVGNAGLSVISGNVQVNSSGAAALTMTGNATMSAADINVVGGKSFNGHGAVTGTVKTGAPVINDPLAGLPAPTEGAEPGDRLGGGQYAEDPQPWILFRRHHRVGKSLRDAQSGHLHSGRGRHQRDGQWLPHGQRRHAVRHGDRAGEPGRQRHHRDHGANPAVNNFAGATTYQGIAIFQDHADTQASLVAGNGSMSINGAIYAPSSVLTVAGNGGMIGSQMVVNELQVNGNGSATVNHASTNLPPEPGLPYLVQ